MPSKTCFSFIISAVLSVFTVISTISGVNAQTTEIPTVAKQVMITDFHSGRVLLEKDKDSAMKPASMAKIMTLYIAFSRIAEGSLSLDDSFVVSEKAWKMGGSRSFLKPGERYSLNDLLYGVAVQSGNDAAVVIAEGLSGSEENFAAEMNLTASRLGMKNTVFTNATGWPDPDLTTTAHDLNLLATALINDFPVDRYPDLYPVFKVKSYTINGIKQGNRNPLLYGKGAEESGIDGLKTGYTEESGYGLVASAQRNGMRIVMVLNGMESKKERGSESRRLMDFIQREYRHYNFYQAEQKVDEVEVWLGRAAYVPVHAAADLGQVLSRAERQKAEVSVKWASPVPAPVKRGQELGQAELRIDGQLVSSVPLLASADIEQLGVFDRLGAALKFLILGASPPAAQ